MRITVDTVEKKLLTETDSGTSESELYSKDSFGVISSIWNRIAWSQKYSYAFTWMGRPIIQLTEDMFRIQEVIYRIKPDIIIETGVAHGGSLIFYATLCHVIAKGRVIGVDIEIRPHNRKEIEGHKLSPIITLVEGSSVDPQVVQKVKSLVRPADSVIVILDSCHQRDHVFQELQSYHSLVSPGSYIVVTDGIMKDLHDVPGGDRAWEFDNPLEAVKEWLKGRSDFAMESPLFEFNESDTTEYPTYWPDGYLRRIG